MPASAADPEQMTNDNTFRYTYTARDNREVLEIRKKYLPQEETRLEELKRLDSLVQSSGVAEALCSGIGGVLAFGLGMCLALEVIGSTPWLGVVLGLAGMAAMIAAFPVYRSIFHRALVEHTPRILELTEELSGNDQFNMR